MDLHDRAFATLSDANYFPGLWALLNSIYAYHGDDLHVFVFSYGLTEQHCERLRRHPLTVEIINCQELAFSSAGAWEAKQQIMAHLIDVARCVFLLDCDLVLTSRLDDVFDAASDGKIVSSTDGVGIDFGNEYTRYQPHVVGQQQPHINSGALCMDVQRHWDLIGLWAFSSRFGSYSPSGGWPLRLPGHGDQGILNALCAMLSKSINFALLNEREWCDCTKGSSLLVQNPESRWGLDVQNVATEKAQRLVHSSGPKWWTPEGKAHLSNMGDKLDVFAHFAGLFPQDLQALPCPASRSSRMPRILVGVCSHGGNRAARDAIRATWMSTPPKNITILFFSAQADPDEPDIIVLACDDHYEALPSKVQAFIRHAIHHEDFDYLFKCDDDTYVVPERLALLIAPDIDLVGDMHIESRGWFSGGAGYIMSQETARIFAEANIPANGPEDVIFAKMARLHDREVRADSRLRSDDRVRPLANNELITAHYLNPETMREAHKTYRESFSP